MLKNAKRVISKLLFAMICFQSVEPIYATSFKIDTLIRDDEIDSILTDWTKQIFRVANISNLKPEIIVVYNPELNAFATLGGHIYVLSGFIDRCEHVGQFLGVLAHEVGHIAGGHIILRDHLSEKTALGSAVPLIIGAAGVLAGGNADAMLAGLMVGSHVYNQSMLKHSRVHEASADQSAFSYLEKLNWSQKGLYEFFEILNKKMSFASKNGLDPYALTHPLTHDRMAAAKMKLANNTAPDFPEKMHSDFNRIKAKLWAFTVDNPKIGPDKRKKLAKFDAFSSKYAEAILSFRQGNRARAIQLIDELLVSNPKDPFLLELKGQFYFEHGKIKESIAPLREAISLRPNAPLMRLMLSQVLIGSKTKENLHEALEHLNRVASQEPNLSSVWRLRGTAYGLLGQESLAKWCLAEEAYSLDQLDRAESMARALLKDSSLPKDKKAKVQTLLDQVIVKKNTNMNRPRRRVAPIN